MVSVNPRALTNKLNETCRRGLEGAAGLCLSRTNYNVEIEHWLLKLLEAPDTDLTRILRHYDVDAGRVRRDLTRALDQLRTGNARSPELSLEILDWMREGWVLASLEHGAARIRSGHLLAALLSDRALGTRARTASAELGRIAAVQLQKELAALIAGSPEDAAASRQTPEAAAPGRAADSQTPALDQFTLNLSEQARRGAIDPVVGRDNEIRQVIDILMRRRQNNPILTGEAGVGKTAVVEGFALRVAAGDVPPPLKGVVIRTLDLGLLQAGAGVKGEFENRLKSVIAEVKASVQPIILFIDEAHTLIGAGGAAGQGDAANLLKPALARGELRTIAATTWNEYKKSFETDAALKRRFQVVKVAEPEETAAIGMLMGLTAALEKHHKVRILQEAVEDAVKLSYRYLTDRQLPDKAVSVLDTSCARVALGLTATPPAVEDCQRAIEGLQVEMAILEREMATGVDHGPRLEELADKRCAAESRLEELRKRWAEEKRLVEKIQELSARLASPSPPTPLPKGERGEKSPPSPPLGGEGLGVRGEAGTLADREELARLENDLAAIQGETPLLRPFVDSPSVAGVVSAWTGVPLGKMVRDEIKTILTLQNRLQERVIGQDHALESIARRIRTARANLVDPRRPIGVFLLLGPSGVGKTETAMALADILYGGERGLVVINMSEYKEDHKISRLTGSAPGYVGYGEGGVLTESVRRKPYCLVLLDEIEKANVAVQEIFYQVFDKGTLQDDKGNEINFKNTIILLTSNVGSDTIMKICADPETRPDAEGLAAALRPDLLKAFKPALLGRLNVVPYFPLTDEVLRQIIRLQLDRIRDRVRANYRAALDYDEDVIAAIARRCQEVESGARNVDHIVTGSLLPELSREFLTCMAEGRPLQGMRIGVEGTGRFRYQSI